MTNQIFMSRPLSYFAISFKFSIRLFCGLSNDGNCSKQTIGVYFDWTIRDFDGDELRWLGTQKMRGSHKCVGNNINVK